MGINLVFERANKDAYDLLVAANEMGTGAELSNVITNTIFPTILNKIGDTIIRSDLVDRNYEKFKIPLAEYGAITEYLVSSMIKAADASSTVTGTRVDDFVVNNPEIKAIYAHKLVRANYPLTVNSDRWLDALDNKNLSTLASMIAIAMQALYDGITHDHDSFIPALFGSLYEEATVSMKRKLPAFTGDDVEGYSKEVFSTLNKAIRDMTTWRRKDFNIVGAEMSDSKADLVLVAFENPIATGKDQTILDVITSQLSIGAQARAAALGSALGIEVYEMPSMGIIEGSVSRAYGLPNFPGMQTADMSNSIQMPPYPKVKFALCGKGAINVGLKRLQTDTGRSIRGHFDQTWVQPTLQLAYGAGQCIFFEDDGELDAALSTLYLNGLTLAPTFDDEKFDYTTTTTHAKNQIIAIAHNPNAVITILHDDEPVPNGSRLEWEDGANVVQVVVKDGAQVQVYKITVTASLE
jgi:hypothetical protein